MSDTHLTMQLQPTTPVHKNVKYNFTSTYAILCRYLSHGAITYKHQSGQLDFRCQYLSAYLQCKSSRIKFMIIDAHKHNMYAMSFYIYVTIKNNIRFYNDVRAKFLQMPEYEYIKIGENEHIFGAANVTNLYGCHFKHKSRIILHIMHGVAP